MAYQIVVTVEVANMDDPNEKSFEISKSAFIDTSTLAPGQTTILPDLPRITVEGGEDHRIRDIRWRIFGADPAATPPPVEKVTTP